MSTPEIKPAPPQGLRTIAFAIAAVSVVLLFLGETVWVGDLSGDEASHVIMAQNIASDFDYFARPSITPLGDLDEKRNIVTFPPGDALLRAVAIKMVGDSFVGSALINALGWGASLFFIYRIARLLGPDSAPWTLILAACSPGLFWMFSWQEAEPTMTAFGLGATWLLTSGHWNRKLLRTVIGGALLGFAVVIKIYLVLPFVVVVAACIVGRWFDDLPPCKFDLKFIALATLGFIPAACSHLIAVWIIAPNELSFWIEQVYLGPLLAPDSAIAQKMEGYERSEDLNHPFWYYLAILYRDHFVLVPILLAAVLDPRRQWQAWRRPEAIALAAGVLVIALWSIPAHKEPIFILPSVSFLYLLCGWALNGSATAALNPSRRLIVLFATIGLGVAIIIAGLVGIKADDITSAYVWLHSIAAIAMIGALFAPQRMRIRLVPALLALLLFAYVGISHQSAEPPINRYYAAALEPVLADAEVREISFLVDDLNELQARLHRTGLMWKDLTEEELAEPEKMLAVDGKLGSVRAFILADEQLNEPRYRALHQAIQQVTKPSEFSGRLLLR